MYLSSKFAGPLKGEILVPGDKSISHRAVILGAIAQGVTIVYGFLEAQDCLATVNAFQGMGVKIELSSDSLMLEEKLSDANTDRKNSLESECEGFKFKKMSLSQEYTKHSKALFREHFSNKLIIYGKGKQGLKRPERAIDCKNSGTTLRLLAGLLAAQPFDTILYGDDSLNKRPMFRVSLPLQEMGSSIETQAGFPPLCIQGGDNLSGIEYTLPLASAQVKSCLLLAGLYAEGTTHIIEPEITRDHTERMLSAFSYPIKKINQRIVIDSSSECLGTEILIPGDFSSAAFFMVAATLIPHSELLIKNVGINPTRTGLLTTLLQMGAKIEVENQRIWGKEPVADLRINYAQLKGISLLKSQISLMIDELPIFCVAAALADGETIIDGASELRFKESDRIHAIAEGLQILGVQITVIEDNLTIRGTSGKALQGGKVRSYGDHRIAMTFAVAGGVAKNPVIIDDCNCLSTSFPNFAALANRINMNVEEWHDA